MANVVQSFAMDETNPEGWQHDTRPVVKSRRPCGYMSCIIGISPSMPSSGLEHKGFPLFDRAEGNQLSENS